MREYNLYENDIPQEIMPLWEERNTLYKKIVQRVKGRDVVLDFGCSSGYGGKHLKNCQVYDGVDKERDVIDFAEKNYGKFRHLHWHWSDGMTFLKRAPNRHYDCVICLDVLHENDRKERELLEEMIRICGRLFFLQIRETPQFRFEDALEIIRRIRPEVDHQELRGGLEPLYMFSRI